MSMWSVSTWCKTHGNEVRTVPTNCPSFVTTRILLNLPNQAKKIKTPNLISELDTIELVGMLQQFWSEGCGDELSLLTQLMDHVCTNIIFLSLKQHCTLKICHIILQVPISFLYWKDSKKKVWFQTSNPFSSAKIHPDKPCHFTLTTRKILNTPQNIYIILFFCILHAQWWDRVPRHTLFVTVTEVCYNYEWEQIMLNNILEFK